MNLKEFIKKYYKKIDTHELELLLEFILKKPKEFIIANPEYNLSLEEQIRLKYYIRQLQKQKPIDYIIGRREFYGLDFKINKYTLVPRPETEQIIDLGKKIISDNQCKNFTIIDIGTGSGNIIISLLKNIQTTIATNNTVRGYASDISPKALTIAKSNAKFHHLNNIKFIRGNLLKPFNSLLTNRTISFFGYYKKISDNPNKKKILLITANLPYLSDKIYNNTNPKVKNYEPKTALSSGKDGLNHYKKLFTQLRGLLSKKNFSFFKTYLLIEISPEQKNKITKEIIKHLPQAKITIHRDLAQKWRTVKIQIKSK